MRSRMSRSYINELRGSTEQNSIPQIDVNNNDNQKSLSLQSDNHLKSKTSSISLPQVRFHNKLSTAFQSAVTIIDHSKLNSIVNFSPEKILLDKPTPSDTNRLTVPGTGDCSLRISNTSSISDDERRISYESRASDVLGYSRMYQNNNRLQFNALRFNDREDLQVKTMPEKTFIFLNLRCIGFN